MAMSLIALVCSLTFGALYLSERLGYRGDITSLTGIVGKVGEEDVNWDTDGDGADDTFSITTYTGGSTNLTKIDARHVPYGSVAAYVDDLVDEGYDLDIFPLTETFQDANGTDQVSFSRREGDGAGFYRYMRDIDGMQAYGDGTDAVGDTFTERSEPETYLIKPRLLLYGLQTFTDGDTTPSVGYHAVDTDMPGNVFATANTGATTITDFDHGDDGQIIEVIIGDSNTTIDCNGGNLYCNACVDWHPQQNDSMICVCDGSDWYCNVSRDRPWWQEDDDASGAVSYNICSGMNIRMYLEGDVTDIATTNEYHDAKICFEIHQDTVAGGGPHTVAFGSEFIVDAGAFTQSTGDNDIDAICFVYDNIISKWVEIGRAQDLAADT